MYKILFRVGGELQFIWKDVKGTFLKFHADDISKSLTDRHVFNVIIPIELYEQHGLPDTFEYVDVLNK